MKERFDYKPRIKSILIYILCIIGGVVVFYLGGIKQIWGAGTVAQVLQIAAPIWTLLFIFGIAKAFKKRSSAIAFIEIDAEFLNVQGNSIPWSAFTADFSTYPTSEDGRSLMFNYSYKSEGSKKSKTKSLDSDKFDSLGTFDDFVKLVVHHSGRDVSSVND